MITTILFFFYLRDLRGWGLVASGALVGAFFFVDAAFLASNLTKVPGGGWFPLAVAAGVYLILSTWRRGRALLKPAKARASSGATCAGVKAVALRAVKGAVTARWSVISCSLPRPMPRSPLSLTLEITSIGTESE